MPWNLPDNFYFNFPESWPTSENPFLGSGSVYWGDPSIKGIYGARVFDLGEAPKKRRFSGQTGAMPITSEKHILA